jgi:hypothetical protein
VLTDKQRRDYVEILTDMQDRALAQWNAGANSTEWLRKHEALAAAIRALQQIQVRA